MAKNPVCGMDVQEKGAQHFIQLDHETFFFCSNQCKKKFLQRSGEKKTSKKKGWFARFLERLAKDNQNTFGGSPPTCH